MSDKVRGGGRPAATEEKEQISPRLPVPLIDKLKEEADANKRTISGQVEVILEDYFAGKEQPKK